MEFLGNSCVHHFTFYLVPTNRRVHISEATKDALKGAYDTEPGDGGSRDDYLEKMDIKTYLIVEKVCLVMCIIKERKVYVQQHCLVPISPLKALLLNRI